MKLSQAIIVLCNPDESRNVGSVCRAMLTMNITKLRIVGSKKNYNENHVNTLALHAKDIWQNASFYDSLEEATLDCVLIAGTTRRRGKKRKNMLLLPEEFTEKVSQIPNTRATNKNHFAIVFGNERTGLTDAELDICTMGVIIPTSKEFGSLNLSHAVQIITYELFKASTQKGDPKNVISSGYTPIPMSAMNKTVQTILTSLQKIGFFKIAGKKDMDIFWKSILTRAILSQGEALYIEKLFLKIAGLASRDKIDISGKNNLTGT